jgi:hypothetical protein
VSSLCSCGPLAYSDNECAKQFLYALNFATLDTEILFSKLKSHELSRKRHLNHDASFTSKALITSACVGGHDANPTNTISSALEFPLSSLTVASSEQYESIPDDKLPYWQGSSTPFTSFVRRGGVHPWAALSATTPPTSSPTAPCGRSLTPSSTTTPTRTTTARATTRTTSETRKRRKSSKRSCPERMLL